MRRSTAPAGGMAATRPRVIQDLSTPQAERPGDDQTDDPSPPAEAGLDNLLSASRVSDILDVTTRTLRRYARAGTLVPVRFGGVVRYRERDLLAFLNPAEPKT